MAASTVEVPVPNPNPYSNPSTQSLQSKKRALECAQGSPYAKIRAVLKDARPFFLEVLRAPHVRHSTASQEILKKMELMVDLCKQMATDTPAIAKCNTGLRGQDGQTLEKAVGEEKKQFSFNNVSHKANEIPKTYIVGNSAFGWNFITFGGTKPAYYGRTKESFRAGN